MYIQVTIRTKDFQELLIALMGEMGYEGFEQEDEALQAYIRSDDFDEKALGELLNAHGLFYTQTPIADRNWNEEWERNFQPVIVDDFCAIRAHFHAPITHVEHELLITPKMSFGTGHHATTYMMIQQMRELDLKGKRVLDFGAGTGVLAILAERLGAAAVTAIDHDDWSIENARENAHNNGCRRVTILQCDTVAGPNGPFDVILANINKHVILGQFAVMGQQLTHGGVILLSGLLEDDFQDIEKEGIRNGLTVFGRMQNGSWICCTAEKKID